MALPAPLSEKRTSMRVLFVTSEFAGLAKAGGLGDVSAALPRALIRQGVDIRVVMPAYPEVLARASGVEVVGELPGRAEIPPCSIGRVRLEDGLTLYLLIAPSLYDRPGNPYCAPNGEEWPDQDLRFGRLSLAAADIARGIGGLNWVPDLLHVNDWPGSLAPAYLHWDGAKVPSLLTAHNVAHQGIFPASRRAALAIPENAFAMEGVEFYGNIAFLKAGLFYASHACAVSQTYAREITTPEFGGGLHGLLAGLAGQGRLSGIVNGIDESWDPARDPYLPYHFQAEDLHGKRMLGELVRTSLCLEHSEGPLFAIVSRLVHQKGLDLVAEAAPEIVRMGGQIAILGMGQPAVEQLLHRVSRAHRDQIGLLVGFNEPMAHRIIAGSDFLLMPSRFEPCGLTQLQAQHCGTLPIAHATGGLVDTIEDGGTGLLFGEATVEGLLSACRRAFEVFSRPAELLRMRRRAMARAFSWSRSAEQYRELYSLLLNGSAPSSRQQLRPKRLMRRSGLDRAA
ncbi:MAG TPA: glycogen synthase GlgA [Roseomonas sp.]|nr:glycogen synthase GlgA [Roseomonas sp.]